jgi:hypothetical protein
MDELSKHRSVQDVRFDSSSCSVNSIRVGSLCKLSNG